MISVQRVWVHRRVTPNLPRHLYHICGRQTAQSSRNPDVKRSYGPWATAGLCYSLRKINMDVGNRDVRRERAEQRSVGSVFNAVIFFFFLDPQTVQKKWMKAAEKKKVDVPLRTSLWSHWRKPGLHQQNNKLNYKTYRKLEKWLHILGHVVHDGRLGFP